MTDLVYNQKFPEHIVSEFRNAEEQCIKSVIKQLLKREPLIADAVRVTRIFRGDHEKYTLAFDNIPIGIVEYNFNPTVTNPVAVRFTPYEEFT